VRKFTRLEGELLCILDPPTSLEKGLNALRGYHGSVTNSPTNDEHFVTEATWSIRFVGAAKFHFRVMERMLTSGDIQGDVRHDTSFRRAVLLGFARSRVYESRIGSDHHSMDIREPAYQRRSAVQQ
jgi:hypothetical protein